MEASSADSTPSPQRSATVSRRHVLSRSSQSLAISQPSPSPQTSGAGPPPSTQVSWPSSMSFVKETQRPSTHMLLAQSLATRHAAPPPHGAQPLAPPQSTPDSSPSLTPFVQEKQTPTVTVTGAVHAQSSVAGVRVRVHRQAGRRVGEAGARVLEADTTVRLRAGGGGVQARAPAAVDVGLVPVRQGVVGREAGVVVAGELVAVDVAAVDVGLDVVLDAVAAVLERRHPAARPRRPCRSGRTRSPRHPRSRRRSCSRTSCRRARRRSPRQSPRRPRRRKPPFLSVKRPAHPYKTSHTNPSYYGKR